jgi:hypothetical protein
MRGVACAAQNGITVDGDLDCSADVDDDNALTGSCAGTDDEGRAIAATVTGAFDEGRCTANLEVLVGGESVIQRDGVDCLDKFAEQ